LWPGKRFLKLPVTGAVTSLEGWVVQSSGLGKVVQFHRIYR